MIIVTHLVSWQEAELFEASVRPSVNCTGVLMEHFVCLCVCASSERLYSEHRPVRPSEPASFAGRHQQRSAAKSSRFRHSDQSSGDGAASLN